MKAIVQEKYGQRDDVLELKDIDKPVVGDDEVLVRVHAASVHPDVWHVVRGRPYALRLMGAGLLKPKNSVPGTDVAGHVESVGKNVTQFPSRRVRRISRTPPDRILRSWFRGSAGGIMLEVEGDIPL